MKVGWWKSGGWGGLSETSTFGMGNNSCLELNYSDKIPSSDPRMNTFFSHRKTSIFNSNPIKSMNQNNELKISEMLDVISKYISKFEFGFLAKKG